MKPVLAYLSELGFMSVVFLDDWLIIGKTKEASKKIIHTSLNLLQNLGFIINFKKIFRSYIQLSIYVDKSTGG